MMNILKTRMPVVFFCLIVLTLACAQTSSATPGAVGTGIVPVDSPLTAAPTFSETEAATAAVGIAVPQNAPLVVYVKEGNIWLWGAVPSPKQLTYSGHDSSPKISDDGQRIAFLRDGDLSVMDSKGGRPRKLVSAHDLAVVSGSESIIVWPRQLAFALRSHDLYFNIQRATGYGPWPEYSLLKINVDSSSLELLLDASQGGGRFVFSPDGKKIALARNDKINLVNADGSGLKTVFSFPAVNMNSEFDYIPEIVWLPDGSGFKTVIPAQDQLTNPAARARFMFISAEGTIVAKLAEFNASLAFANRPFISPDGSKVLYVKAHGADFELHIIDASTADQSYFSHAADTFGILGWTPDSVHVVYWADARSSLWLGPQQSGAIELTDVPNVEDIFWVDAHHYFFVAHAYELRLRTLGQPSILIDDGLSESAFDFTTVH